jgi:predicted nucleic acid-binding protein
MIVVDANIVVYCLIESENAALIRALREKDADWRTAPLCLHEILNVLATYQRRKVWSLAQCKRLLEHAERFVETAQCEIDLASALAAAARYGISGYDAQYTVLAQHLDAPLIPEDRQLRNAAPGIAFSMTEILA